MNTRRAVKRTAALAGTGFGLRYLLRDEERRERFRRAVLGIRDAVLPSRELPEPAEAPGPFDESHARGHRHVGPPEGLDEADDLGDHERGEPWSETPSRWGSVHHRA